MLHDGILKILSPKTRFLETCTTESRVGQLDLDVLLELARHGDSEGLTELYHQFAPRVFGLCRHMLGSREAAEDATSEVFMRLQRSVSTYNSSVPFLRWLFSIASHYCVDVLRRQRVERRIFMEEESELPPLALSMASPLSEAMMGERRAEVQKAIARLPQKYRLPLVLRYYSDFGYNEIAEHLGLERSHVATLLFRARQELRRTLAGFERELIS